MPGIDDQVLTYSPRLGTFHFADGTEIFCNVLWSKNDFNNAIVTNPEFEEED